MTWNGEAPDLDTRIQMFMDLSQEFIELVPQGNLSLAFGDSLEARVAKRQIVLATALFRKFVVKKENVRVATILHSLGGDKRIDSRIRKKIRANQKYLTQILENIYESGGSFLGVAEPLLPEVLDLMYGHLLHSDYERFIARPSSAQWLAVGIGVTPSATGMHEQLKFYRNLFAGLKEMGVFPELKYAEVIYADLMDSKGQLVEQTVIRTVPDKFEEILNQ